MTELVKEWHENKIYFGDSEEVADKKALKQDQILERMSDDEFNELLDSLGSIIPQGKNSLIQKRKKIGATKKFKELNPDIAI